MSTVTKKRQTLAEVAERAARQLDLDDIKRVSLALVEAASVELEKSHTFENRVRAFYDALAPARPRSRMVTAFDVKLVPIKQIDGREINPAAPLDPYFLYEVYGAEQLPTALSIFPVSKLKEGAAKVEQQNPGTKPSNRGQKQALIDYIVKYVAY